MLKNLHGSLIRLTRWLALLGAGLLTLGMLITVADILIRTRGNGIFGSTELTQLAMLMIVFLAIPYTFLIDGHVGVELFTDGLAPRMQAVFKTFAALLGLVFMSAIFWFGARKALQKMEYGDVSMNLGIPLGVFWAPMLLGFGLSVLALALIALGHLMTALRNAPPLAPPRQSLPE